MRALVLTRYGAPFEWADVPMPQAGEGEVLIRVHAAGLNPLDDMIRRGDMKSLHSYHLPHVMGNDLAGVVVDVGSGVSGVAEGEEVYARPSFDRLGAFAEYVSLPASDVAPKPKNLTMVEAASLPLVTLTAMQAFTEKTSVGPDSKVFIQGGAGGLGSAAIQVAKMLGAAVATTVGTADVQLAHELGANIVVDYRTQQYEDFIQDFDVVLDTLGGVEIKRSMRTLRPGGTLVSVIGKPDADLARQIGKPYLAPVMRFLGRKERAAAKAANVTYKFLFMRADGNQLARITEAVEAGLIRPLVAHAFPFVNLAEELAELGKKKAGAGKTVVEVVAS